MEYTIKTEQDVNIYVNDINPYGKKVILFVHGWPLSHRHLNTNSMSFLKWGTDVLVWIQEALAIQVSLLGYNYNRLAEDVRCVVDSLKLRNFVLAGHSMGGATVIRYMSLFKDMVFQSWHCLPLLHQALLCAPTFLTVSLKKI